MSSRPRWTPVVLVVALAALPFACAPPDNTSSLLGGGPQGGGAPPGSTSYTGTGPQGQPVGQAPSSSGSSTLPPPTSTSSAPPSSSASGPPPPTSGTADASAPAADASSGTGSDAGAEGDATQVLVDASAPEVSSPDPGPPPVDASAPDVASSPVDTGTDTGSLHVDSGSDTGTATGVDATAPSGSCGNPQCETDDQGDCFCTAQVGADNYQLGCNPDGTCACFLNEAISNGNVDQPGVCQDLAAAGRLFV